MWGYVLIQVFLEKMSGDRSYVRVLEALQARIEGLKRQLTGWALLALTENSASVSQHPQGAVHL